VSTRDESRGSMAGSAAGAVVAPQRRLAFLGANSFLSCNCAVDHTSVAPKVVITLGLEGRSWNDYRVAADVSLTSRRKVMTCHRSSSGR
jgi:hypothetical protein